MTRALEDAFREVFDAPMALLLAPLAADGWTPSTVHWLGTLVDEALTRGAGICAAIPTDWTDPDHRAHARRFLAAKVGRQAHTLVTAGLSLTDALAWLTMHAGAPDPLDLDSIGGPAHAAPGQAAPLAAWQETGLEALAPWAYAAGLSPHEARHQHAAGLLDERSLRALAALRGYQCHG